MDLNFKAQGQRLIRTDSETVAENSMNYLYAAFELDGSWTGFGIKAVFEHRGSSYYSLVEGGRCAVPAEVIRWSGFSVSLIGTDGDNNVRITTLREKVHVEEGPALEARNASTPTLSELEQIESSVQNLNDRLDDIASVTGECDPTVPAWAKEENKPVYTAAEVGADLAGTAASAVNAHNGSNTSHSGMRRQIKDLEDNKADRSELPAMPTLKELDGITSGEASGLVSMHNVNSSAHSDIRELIDEINIPTKLSDLTNDKGYITDFTETDPTVPSWAKESSKPYYTKSEVGLGNVDNVKQYSEVNPPPYPVTSVNGQTGAVTVTLPTKTSQLTNDSKFVTESELSDKGYAVKSNAEDWSFTLDDGSTVTKKVVLG